MRNKYTITPGGRFSGYIRKNDMGLKTVMLRDSILRIEGGGRRLILLNCNGSLWITQESDRKDHFLGFGEIFVIYRQGLTVIYALSDVDMEIRQDYEAKTEQ